MFKVLALLTLLAFTTAYPGALTARDDGSSSPEGQLDGYPYPSVKFNSTWPAVIKTDEAGDGSAAVKMSWTGGSGLYNFWWLESWKDDAGHHTEQYYVLRNASWNSYEFSFSPSGCWKRNASFLFGVEEGNVSPGSVTQRDHDTGPLLYLVRGPNDTYTECDNY